METTLPFVPYGLIMVLTAIPALTLLKRVGLSRAWALLSFVPLGMLIILWIVAYRRWPVLEPHHA